MTQGATGHFSNNAAVSGTGSRGYLRFGKWKIGAILTASFAAIVLMMTVGGGIAVFQLNRVEIRASRFYQADQKSLAIMHVYLDVVTVRDTLTGLARNQNSQEFASQATALRDSFLRDVAHAQETLSSTPEVNQDPTILIRLETVRAALPAQVDTLLELVKVGDWQAVRFRLAGQEQVLIALSSSLVADVEREVAQERARALEGIRRTRRELYLVLPITALLILLMAVVLGWYATRRISKPLAQLDAGAQALARGEFGYQVALSGDDELADLAGAFNYAAQQIQKLYNDIKRSEAYLAESNAKLEEAQRITHVGYWEWDILTDRVSWSDEAYRIYGMQPQERAMCLATVQEKIHPEDWQRAMEAVLGGVRFEVECRLSRPTGEVRIAHFDGDVKKDASGKPCRIFGTIQDITDRKRAEQRLRESEAYLAEAQRLSQTGSWAWNPATGDIRYWSEMCFSVLGFDPAGPLPRFEEFVQRVHENDQARLNERFDEAVRDKEDFELDYRVVHPEKGIRDIHVVGHAILDVSGNLDEFVGTVIDVTERKCAEEALQKSELYLSEGQRLAHMGSWAFNPSGFFEYWSQELFEVYGLDPQKGAPSLEQYLATIHVQDRDFMANTIKRMQAERSGCDVKKRVVRLDGEQRYIRCVGIPVLEGEVLKGFLGTAIDVTEQELLTQELRREQAYLTDSQSMAHIGGWAYNLVTHKLLHSSDANARLYGFDPSQGPIPTERFFDTILAEDEPRVTATLDNAARTGTDFYLHEYRIRHTDGGIRFLRAIGRRNPSGEPGEYVGVTMDITELKSAEHEREKLRQLEADLAHIDRVSTLGEMAASLAHEIKQPIAAAITSANSCIEWLAHEPPNLDRARAAAARIDKYGNRAAEIIDRIRSFYKKTPPQRELVNVNGVIQEILTLLRGEANRYSVAMRMDLSADLPKIMVDRVQLQQVFMNLMLNAIEAMNDSGGELTVKSELQDDQLHFSVSDTGVGLPTDVDQMFSAFFTTKPQGSGMGLAISRSIVESHGGQLWASANSGRGATFYFTLPTDHRA
jgi:PAS domain S-box-containing protein